MKLSVCLYDKQYQKEIEIFLSTTDRTHWTKRLKELEDYNGLYKKFLTTRNPFLEPIKEYCDLKSKGLVIRNKCSDKLRLFAGRAYIINRIIHNINDVGKRQLISRLKDNDLRSLLFEISTATHFFRNDFDVNFVEYERSDNEGRTFDFVIEKNSIKAEVECKWKSINAGRKITQDGFYNLVDNIVKQLKGKKISCLFEIKIPQKLGKNLTEFTDMALALKSAVELKQTEAVFSDFEINIKYLPVVIKNISEEKLKTIVKFDRTRNQHVASYSRGSSTIIIKIECEKKDEVLNAIYADLKDSLEQFSKKKAGLIACNIEGVLGHQWKELSSESGLAEKTRKLFEKETAVHIHTVVYTSEDGYELKQEGVVEIRSICLTFLNPKRKFKIDQRFF